MKKLFIFALLLILAACSGGNVSSEIVSVSPDQTEELQSKINNADELSGEDVAKYLGGQPKNIYEESEIIHRHDYDRTDGGSVFLTYHDNVLVSLSEFGAAEGFTSAPPSTNQSNSQDGTISNKARDIISDLTNVSINDIQVNENLGSDDPDDYIVLAHLSFDANNWADTARDMIDMYNNELGAKMADVEGVSELTIFWEVPFLLEGDNIAKANLERVEGGMAFREQWYDPFIFD